MDVNMIKDKIESARTKNGGWTKETLQSLGVAWPPKKGWKKELIEKELREQIARDIEIKGDEIAWIWMAIGGRTPEAVDWYVKDVNANLHRIAACMVMPMKKTLFGWKVSSREEARCNCADW